MSVPIVLENPRLDSLARTLLFDVRADQGASLAQVPSDFQAVSLFIDNASENQPSLTLQLLVPALASQGISVAIVDGPGSPAFFMNARSSQLLTTGATISNLQYVSDSISVVFDANATGNLDLQLAVRGTSGLPPFLTLYTETDGITALLGSGAVTPLTASGFTNLAWA